MPHAGGCPDDLVPMVPDLLDHNEAEGKQVAASPRVPAALVLRERALSGSLAGPWPGPTTAQAPRSGTT